MLANQNESTNSKQTSFLSKAFVYAFLGLRIFVTGSLALLIFAFFSTVGISDAYIVKISDNTFIFKVDNYNLAIGILNTFGPPLVIIIVLSLLIVKLFYYTWDQLQILIKKIIIDREKSYITYYQSHKTYSDLPIDFQANFELRNEMLIKHLSKIISLITSFLGFWIVIFGTLSIDSNTFSLGISLIIIGLISYYYFNNYYQSHYIANKIKYDEQRKKRLVKKGLLKE